MSYNPQDYWTGSGYSQIPQDQSNYNPYYTEPAPWANANTYAPNTPDQGGTHLPSFGERYDANSGGGWGGVLSGLIGAEYGWLFGTGKKRSSPDYYAPSYQGTPFTPSEGFPKYYNPSQEGQAVNQTQQDYYNQGQLGSTMQNRSNGSYNYNYGDTSLSGLQPEGNPDYIGQTIYGAYGGSPYGNMAKPYSPYNG